MTEKLNYDYDNNQEKKSTKADILSTHFNDLFLQKMGTPEWQKSFEQTCKNLVENYGVSPDFLDVMEKEWVFAWYAIADIIHPKTVSVMKEESDKLYFWTRKVRKAMRDSSLNIAANDDQYYDQAA